MEKEFHMRKQSLMDKEFDSFADQFCYFTFVGGSVGVVVALVRRKNILRNISLGLGLGSGFAYCKGNYRFENIYKIDKMESEGKRNVSHHD